MSAPVDVCWACCDKSNINHMQSGAIINAVCIACGTHWYGPAKDVRRFTRKEWDAFLEIDASPDDSGVIPAVSMLDGFIAYLRDLDASVSERSLRSLRAAVAELIEADRAFDAAQLSLHMGEKLAAKIRRNAALARIGGAA